MQTATTEKHQKPIAPAVRVALRTVYVAGFVGTGYALWELLTRAGLQDVAALFLVVLIELFAVTASTYSTRARLRGEGGFLIRNVMALGAMSSAGMQFTFHWHDNRVLAVALPLASILALILWVLDVNDQHSTIFAAQRQARQAKRHERKANLIYAYANGFKQTHADWKDRVVEVGATERDVLREVTVAGLNDLRPALTFGADVPVTAVPADAGAPVSPAPWVPASPKPPTFNRPPVDAPRQRRQIHGRPTSPAPASTVVGDDEHAEAMRVMATVTEAARYAWAVHGHEASPAALVRWLDEYGVTISRPAVSMQRPKITEGANA